MNHEIRGEQVLLGVGELLSTHYLVSHMKRATHHQKLRLAVGATMAGVGYFIGPELEERIRGLGDQRLNDRLRRQAIYTGGAALLGGVGTYLLTKQGDNPLTKNLEAELSSVASASQAKADPELASTLEEIHLRADRQINPFLGIAAAGFLGYSLFFDGKTAAEQRRHLWGLGAGAAGYLLGPEALGKVKSLVLPSSIRGDVLEMYARGSAVLGAGVGAVAGWYLSGGLTSLLQRQLAVAQEVQP